MGRVHQQANARRWMCGGFMRMSSQDPYKQGSREGSGLGGGRFWAVMQSQKGLSSEAEKAPFCVVSFWGEVLALMSLHQPILG